MAGQVVGVCLGSHQRRSCWPRGSSEALDSFSPIGAPGLRRRTGTKGGFHAGDSPQRGRSVGCGGSGWVATGEPLCGRRQRSGRPPPSPRHRAHAEQRPGRQGLEWNRVFPFPGRSRDDEDRDQVSAPKSGREPRASTSRKTGVVGRWRGGESMIRRRFSPQRQRPTSARNGGETRGFLPPI